VKQLKKHQKMVLLKDSIIVVLFQHPTQKRTKTIHIIQGQTTITTNEVSTVYTTTHHHHHYHHHHQRHQLIPK
jgi:hypothetical protein